MKFSEKNNSRTCKHTKSIAVSFSHEITKELTVQCRGHSGTVWWFFYEKELIEEKSNEKKWYVFVTKKLIDGKSNWKVIFLMKRTYRWVQVRQDCQTHKLLSFPVLHTTKRNNFRC
jgi:hypothetical protein